MKKWNTSVKPPLDECPKHYCFCWVPPGGEGDLSGKVYDSCEEAVDPEKKVLFLHGGCAAPFGKCRRETKQSLDADRYEPFNRVLKRQGLPELYFCDPSNLTEEDRVEYQEMANLIWDKNA